MFQVKLKPVRSTINNASSSEPSLTGTVSEFDTSILKGDPIGRRDIGASAPLPAQPEAFKKVVDEKIEQFKISDVAIAIDVWRDNQSGRTHIMDGQHRFIAAAVLARPIQLRWKKFGARPTDVDWSGTKYIEGIPAKDRIRSNIKK